MVPVYRLHRSEELTRINYSLFSPGGGEDFSCRRALPRVSGMLGRIGAALLLCALLVPPVVAQERVVTDGAGRQVKIPAHIARVFAAGSPAAITLYTLAPTKLLGWTGPLR